MSLCMCCAWPFATQALHCLHERPFIGGILSHSPGLSPTCTLTSQMRNSGQWESSSLDKTAQEGFVTLMLRHSRHTNQAGAPHEFSPHARTCFTHLFHVAKCDTLATFRTEGFLMELDRGHMFSNRGAWPGSLPCLLQHKSRYNKEERTSVETMQYLWHVVKQQLPHIAAAAVSKGFQATGPTRSSSCSQPHGKSDPAKCRIRICTILPHA